jgi:hypothetical protein
VTSAGGWLRALVGVALFGLACQDPEPHPPLASPCAPGQRCSLGLGQVGGPSPTTGGTGAGGGAGTGGSAGNGAGVLRGTVADLVDDTFLTSIPFGDPATVEGQSSTGAVIHAAWNGIDPFLLSGVESAAPSWISVRPDSGIANLRTLHPIATTIERNVDLGLVRADAIDEILGLLDAPTQRAQGSAQIVLVFSVGAGASSVGATGVRVALADSQVVAYQDGAVWSSDAAGTGSSGLAILANVPAVVFPGTTKRIVLSGTSSGFVDVRVAGDAVSLVAVPLSP